ncbi:MBL fold metallo-hydrolase [Oricola sp.]|uniref:MBL fold metallo-hydrolase n=1 Tax=Oricola sp. TaxID=1979950 RepID=UPI003BA9BFAB
MPSKNFRPNADAGKARLTRRRLVQGAAALPVIASPALALARQLPVATAPSYYAFKIGRFDALSVSDGALPISPLLPTFGTNAEEASLGALAETRSLNEQSALLHMNHLVVDTGGSLILVDPGGRAEMGPTMGFLPQNLKAAGINPADIDKIVITHGHPDHVMATVNPDGSLAFPNAEYFISAAEWEFWADETPDLRGMQMPDDFKAFTLGVAQSSLGAIGKRVTMVQGDDEIASGVYAIQTPGHTPGHMSLLIDGGDEQLIHMTDVVHHHVTSLAHPEWTPAFDLQPELGTQSRSRLLGQLATDRTLALAYHFPFPGLGYVTRRRQGYGWEPAVWSW